MDSERQPLLPTPRKETPLPKLQLAVIMLVRVAEPVAFTQIFPYINRMVEWLDVTDDPAQIGWYSGLIDSAFAVAQLTMIYNWAKLSDRIGRKPCVLISITGSATATLLFGFSTNIYTAVFARCMAGFMAGTVAVIQSMVGELTDKTKQARAFVLVDLIWYSGSIMGTLLGGMLSEPAARFPETLGRVPLLVEYPFLLPCFIAYAMAMAGVVFGWFCLKETHPDLRHFGDAERKQAADIVTLASQRPPSQPEVTAWSLLEDPVFRSILAPYFLLALQCIGFEVLFTLFSYTPISFGGLSRSPFEIGVALAFGGVAAVVMHPIAFPWLAKRVNLKTLYTALMFLFPICFVAAPLLNYASRAFTEPEELDSAGRTVLWVLIGLLLLLARAAGMAFAAHTIFVKRTAPNPQSLGRVFGIVQTIGATGRAVGPAFVSALFALTAEYRLMGGWFVWLFMVAVGGFAIYLCRLIRDDGSSEREMREVSRT